MLVRKQMNSCRRKRLHLMTNRKMFLCQNSLKSCHFRLKRSAISVCFAKLSKTLFEYILLCYTFHHYSGRRWQDLMVKNRLLSAQTYHTSCLILHTSCWRLHLFIDLYQKLSTSFNTRYQCSWPTQQKVSTVIAPVPVSVQCITMCVVFVKLCRLLDKQSW